MLDLYTDRHKTNEELLGSTLVDREGKEHTVAEVPTILTFSSLSSSLVMIARDVLYHSDSVFRKH